MDLLGGLLTNGLSGGTAYNHLIFGSLSLLVSDVEDSSKIIGGGGGTSIRDKSSITKLFRKSENNQDDQDHLVVPKKQVKLLLTINNKIHEKTFIVDTKNGEKIIKIIKWVNVTKSKITIFLNKITKITKKQ